METLPRKVPQGRPPAFAHPEGGCRPEPADYAIAQPGAEPLARERVPLRQHYLPEDSGGSRYAAVEWRPAVHRRPEIPEGIYREEYVPEPKCVSLHRPPTRGMEDCEPRDTNRVQEEYVQPAASRVLRPGRVPVPVEAELELPYRPRLAEPDRLVPVRSAASDGQARFRLRREEYIEQLPLKRPRSVGYDDQDDATSLSAERDLSQFARIRRDPYAGQNAESQRHDTSSKWAHPEGEGYVPAPKRAYSMHGGVRRPYLAVPAEPVGYEAGLPPAQYVARESHQMYQEGSLSHGGGEGVGGAAAAAAPATSWQSGGECGNGYGQAQATGRPRGGSATEPASSGPSRYSGRAASQGGSPSQNENGPLATHKQQAGNNWRGKTNKQRGNGYGKGNREGSYNSSHSPAAAQRKEPPKESFNSWREIRDKATDAYGWKGDNSSDRRHTELAGRWEVESGLRHASASSMEYRT
mmetsp:Transcript_20378/g.56474  ORF Transcript_20378/g.56474 Transcript_20378/m.56474 type:complete len:467 (-) Transcript_20378:353-1753(-)